MQFANHSHCTARSTRRRGVALVMFVMLVFGFMAIAALCIDMGMASLTQAQMQSAVDVAALEGISSRDFFEHRGGSNLYRRNLVREMARVAFDDDLSPTESDNDEDHHEYSAGPIFHLEGGMESVPNASATLVVPEPGNYALASERYLDDPELQINLGHFLMQGDLPQGDMVAGMYRPLGAHVEEPLTYLRGDFESASQHTTFPQSNLLEGRKGLAFLVRMRRTPLANGPAHLSNPDNNPLVSSAGPTIPFLFGLGSTIHAADGDDYDPRRDGITVRATAIASAMPALTVGVLPFDETCAAPMIRTWESAPYTRFMYGTGAIALTREYWFSLPVPNETPGSDVFQPLTLNESTGELMTSDLSTVAGRICLGDTTGCRYGELTAVGQSISDNAPGAAVRLREWVQYVNLEYDLGPGESLAGLGKFYVPIYEEIPNAAGVPVQRVIGFGHATFRFDTAADPATATKFLILKGWPDNNDFPIGPDRACVVSVAPENASATLSGAAIEMAETEWDLVSRYMLNLTYPDYPAPPAEAPANWAPSFDWRDIRPGALLAPALVR